MQSCRTLKTQHISNGDVLSLIACLSISGLLILKSRIMYMNEDHINTTITIINSMVLSVIWNNGTSEYLLIGG